MDQNNNKKPSDDDLKELEDLIEQLKELEEERSRREKNNKKTPRGVFTIEFGGVYHTNPIINFIFSLIINISLSYLIVQTFHFAQFEDIYMYLLFITVYTIIEGLVKTFITHRYFKYIIQSMGFILYLSYLAIFYVLDVYVFDSSFTFNADYHFVAFVTIFVLVRYFVGTLIKRYLRSRIKR